jgi:hypothetical protein
MAGIAVLTCWVNWDVLHKMHKKNIKNLSMVLWVSLLSTCILFVLLVLNEGEDYSLLNRATLAGLCGSIHIFFSGIVSGKVFDHMPDQKE